MTDDVKLLNFVNSSDFLAYGAILPVECDRSRAGFKKYSTPYIYIYTYTISSDITRVNRLLIARLIIVRARVRGTACKRHQSNYITIERDEKKKK